MPKNAIEMESLVQKDSLAVYSGRLFSGVAYENYPNKNLHKVISYDKGIQHGLMMVWYSDGTPQLFTSYYRGSPHGRFIGWYSNGMLLYNMVLSRGRMGGDYIYEDDISREQSEQEIIEREGTEGNLND